MLTKEQISDMEHRLMTTPGSQSKIMVKELLKEYLSYDFFAFVKFLGFNEAKWKTHGELIEVLQSPSKRKIICFPRGGFKSSIASVAYPIWCLVKDPNHRILIDSEIFNNSKNFLREIKGLMKTDHFMEIYGDLEGDKWHEAEITISTRTVIKKEASITVGGVGTTKVGQHYSKILGDDYNSQDNSSTPEKCQKVIDHFKYNLNILEPDGEYVIIGTRYSENDLIGFLLREILEDKDLAEGKLKAHEKDHNE